MDQGIHGHARGRLEPERRMMATITLGEHHSLSGDGAGQNARGLPELIATGAGEGAERPVAKLLGDLRRRQIPLSQSGDGRFQTKATMIGQRGAAVDLRKGANQMKARQGGVASDFIQTDKPPLALMKEGSGPLQALERLYPSGPLRRPQTIGGLGEPRDEP